MCRALLAYGSFKRLIKAAGVPDICFHGLRHTFASWFMIQDGDMWQLMEMLGHADISTTRRYSHHSPKQRRAVALDWSEGVDSHPHQIRTSSEVVV